VEGREDGTMSSENQGQEDDNDRASGTAEECSGGDAEALDARMEGAGAVAENEEYFDDTSFDEQLEDLDWESGEDPFDAREWEIIRNNLEP